MPGVTLGHEFVGQVVETGSQVRKVKSGDRVSVNVETFCGECFFCRKGFVNNCTDKNGGWALGCRIDGGQAEYVRVPYADHALTRIPDSVSDEQALFVGDILATGYWAAKIGELKPADTVAVIGAGPAGLCTMMCARLYTPAKIIAIDPDESRLALAKEQGLADVILVPGKEEIEKSVLRETGGRGADRVFEMCIRDRGDSIAGEKIPARSANAVEISRTAAAGGGFLGKKAAVRVLAGLLAVSVGGGAAVFVFRQREKEREAVEVMQEPEVTKEAQVTEEPKVTEEPQVTEVPDKTELLVGHWEGEAQDAFGEYVMTLDFSAEGQADYMLGWKLSEMALLSHGTYTLEGDLLRLVFEKNEITGESMNWECVYRIKTDGEVLEMEYVSGNSLSDFQMEGIRFSYKKTAGVGVQ